MPEKISKESDQQKKRLHPLLIFFLLLALISTLGQDYLSFKKEEECYFFGFLKRKEDTSKQKVTLEQLIFKSLQDYGVPLDSIHKYKDEEEVFHFMVNLPSKKYHLLEASFEKKLQESKAKIIRKEEQMRELKKYHFWEVKGKKGQRLILLFSCEEEITAEKEKATPRERKNKVAIIVDDMGFSLEALKELLSLRKPLTVAILPFSPLARETALLAHENNLEVILHLPLESINSLEASDGSQEIIRSQMAPEEIVNFVKESIERVPFIKGVNNHMGSKITTDEKTIRIILEQLKLKNLFFIDSRTSSKSIAFREAQTLGIPSTARDIFLDVEKNEDYIKKKMLELFRLAQREGEALGICHPFPETLKVLKENFSLVEKLELEPVFASRLLKYPKSEKERE